MDQPSGGDRQGKWARLTARVELLVPVLGLLILRAMLGWEDVRLAGWQTILIYGAAVLYTALVLWSPPKLPAKEPQTFSRTALRRTVLLIGLLILAGFGVLTLLSLTSDAPPAEGRLGLGGALAAILLLTLLGTAGVVAERRLPLDLFPVLRRREPWRIFYVLLSALFLAVVVQLWGGIWSDLAAGIGRTLGETPPTETEVATRFDAGNPLRLFLNFLIGAGLFEELLFRVGIMTPVWFLTRRWGWGLLVSAVTFGLYHISPLSSMATVNLQAPVTAVVESFGVGLAMGVLYRYRGFMAAVMAHALGNWLVVLIFFAT